MAKVKITVKEEIKAQPSIEDEWKKILRGEDLEPAKSQVKEPVEVVKEELMSDDTEDAGVDFLKQLIEKMGLRATVTKKVDDDMFMLDVTGRSLGALIGRHGETLDSVQYLDQLSCCQEHQRERKRGQDEVYSRRGGLQEEERTGFDRYGLKGGR